MVSSVFTSGVAIGFQGGNFFRRDAIDKGPKIRRSPREPSFRAKNSSDLIFSKCLLQPGNGVVIAILQDAEDGVVRIGPGVELIVPDIPKERS